MKGGRGKLEKTGPCSEAGGGGVNNLPSVRGNKGFALGVGGKKPGKNNLGPRKTLGANLGLE